MNIKLLFATPLDIAVKGARVCYLSKGKTEQDDFNLLEKIIKLGHESVIEHVVFNFKIEGMSRACLHEFVRHRIASYSVQSTRYTLKKVILDEIKVDELFCHTGIEKLDNLIKRHIIELIELAKSEKNIPNDMLKYALPEAFKINLVWTINTRALRNFLKLRTAKKAHWEIRMLANKIKDLLFDTEYKILIEDLFIVQGDYL